jgi:hypothetical protein
MNQGSGAMRWLIADVNDDKQHEVVQLWENGGRLGMIIYRWTGSAMATLWGTTNWGQGAGGLSWLIGDLSGNGRANVAQQWANGGRLGMIIYKYLG